VTSGSDLHFLSIAEAAALIRTRALSPVELIDAFLRRIDLIEREIHSYISIDADHARAAAAAAEREIAAGSYRGSLHGVPYGLKDTIDVAGRPTTANSRLMRDFVPTVDAVVHSRLQVAGAILLGKLNTYEFGTGTGADHGHLPFPPARNPWNTACFPGGSSTGAGAAVAAGTAMFAIGADTGGSIRLPAAACGVVGLKPTYDLVSRAGVLPNCKSLDHIGPVTRTAADAALVLPVIAAREGHARRGTDIAGLRVGVIRRFHERDLAPDGELSQAFDEVVAVLRGLGASVVELDLGRSQQDFIDCMRLINNFESYSHHRNDFLERRGEMGPALYDKFMAGLCLPTTAYAQAQRRRRNLNAQVGALFERCDVLVSGCAARPAPPLEYGAAVAAFTSEAATMLFSLSGDPALSLCIGFSSGGLPLALQIAGRHFDEATVLRVADAYQQATDWHRRRPSCAAFPVGPYHRPVDTAIQPIDPAVAFELLKRAGIDRPTPRDVEICARQAARMASMAARIPADPGDKVE
jgi:aspartyl-tRNA(Asn)/glutamyl-tRNA(Gln) amidotransferase subunit A